MVLGQGAYIAAGQKLSAHFHTINKYHLTYLSPHA